MDLEVEIKEIFENAFKTDVTRQVFIDYLVDAKSYQQELINCCLKKFHTVFMGQKSEERLKVLTNLIKFTHSQKSTRRVKFMFDFLDACIAAGSIPVRTILDALQGSDLVYTKKLHWCRTYDIIRKYIHMMDYKGCRNLLQGMISKMRTIPSSSWEVCYPQVQCICELICHLINPESCLLPGYLAVNEFSASMADDPVPAPPPLQDKLMSFVDRFCATASMVTTSGRWALLPVIDGSSYQLPITWRLEPEQLRFHLRRTLPYCKEMYQTQSALFRHVFKSTSSRDILLQMVGIQKQQKQRCPAMERELVSLLMDTMERSVAPSTDNAGFDAQTRAMWHHLSSQSIQLFIYHTVSFPHLVEKFHSKFVSKKQSGSDIGTGREYLMWCFLHYVSGSIQKNPLSDFLPLVKLIHLLYHESEPLPLPDVSKSYSAISFSPICILTNLIRKSQSTGSTEDHFDIEVPTSLLRHHEFLRQCLQAGLIPPSNYRISLVCNASSGTTDVYSAPVTTLLNTVSESGKNEPLTMELLDSLTAQPKMSMLHQLGSTIQKLGQSKSGPSLSPALTETYSRLLVYSELETLGIKALVGQVFPKILELKNWGILNLLVELVSYRTYHILPGFRMQLLSIFHSLANSQHNFARQLLFSIENAALRLTMGFGNFDIKPQLMRALSDNKPFVSQTSEELNRVLVLMLAQSIHITGAESVSEPWCVDILKAVMNATPHRWPQHTLACFPPILQQYYQQQQQPEDSINRKTLKANVEDDYEKWGKVLAAENEATINEAELVDIVRHFCRTNNSSPFICLVWKVLFEGKTPSSVIYRVLMGMTSQQLCGHIRTFSDFLVHELFTSDTQPERVQLCTQVILDMVWKYNIVPLDRLILCLALRSSELNDVQVAFFIIPYLLIKTEDFRNQVRAFVQEVESTEYWMLPDWHSHHVAFQQKFPASFNFEGLHERCIGSKVDSSDSDLLLPSHFCNITLRFLPVLDILIHRCLEIPSAAKSLGTLLGHLGPLYKFHDRPITYLFNTLHYYESRFRDMRGLKKKLVCSIVKPISESRPESWTFSAEFMNYLDSSGADWTPNPPYFVFIVRRLVDTILERNPPPFPLRDWRFNEFANASAHALHVTCVEVLSLPTSGGEAGKSLMDVVLKTQPEVEKSHVISWMNAVGLLLTALPDVYWNPLHEEIMKVLTSATLTAPIPSNAPYPYHILDYNKQSCSSSALYCTRLLGLTHIVWHHMSIGQLSSVSQFLKDDVKPLVCTEMQLLYVFHLIGPYFPRFRHERTRCMIDVATALYDMLLQVSEGSDKIEHVDEISDFLYNIKYMHIGTAILDKTVEVVGRLQPRLRQRLQFITHTAPRLQTV